ncbi:MAG TPA: hypothetical protein ENH86_01890 [Candidatus Jorgensenbacteria bacterium]|uniref:Solute-binding protein family 5 domain-containing protein n=1 Tax=marine sediment metagenome TaxID=412755 RepID=A0A0F9JI44_9ZZZZ|nr:hypothetical protein [Candidatus Jorgensenbacteria bacterium]
MGILSSILYALTRKERIALVLALVLFAVASVTKAVVVVQERSIFVPVSGGMYREGVVGQPQVINPVLSGNQTDQELSALLYGRLGVLADRIEISEDERTYTITLKQDLVWDDGELLTSDDVVFTVKTIQDPEVRSSLYKNWQGVIVERISALQIKFTLPSPFVFFNDTVANLSIIPKHVFSTIPASNIRLSSYNLEPIGSGPYSFRSFSKRRDGFITEYRLVANEDYVGDTPYIEEFYFRFYEDDEALMGAFRTRDIDGFGILSLPNEGIRELPNAQIIQIPMTRYYAVFFNPKATSMLKNETFREALSLAIDKDALVNDVLRNEGNPIDGPFYADIGPVYEGFDPERAADLITEAKEDSDTKTLVIKLMMPDVPFIKDVAEFIKNEWKEAGVDEVTTISLNNEDFFSVVLRERNYEAVLFGNVLEHNLDLFPFWHSSERFYPGLNLSFYADDAVDIALEDIRQNGNVTDRREEFIRAAMRIQKNTPAAFLFSLPYTYVHGSRLYGVSFDSFITVPSERFRNVTSWYVTRARVLNNQPIVEPKPSQ